VVDGAVRRFRGRDGLELAYREVGSGRTLILLHGFTVTAKAAWLDTGIAGRIAAHGYRVVLPDLRAHGDSAKPHDAASYPLDVLVDDGFALIDELGVTDYDLAGYSLGGRTVAQLLARGATPGRAVVAGQGLEAILHTEGRGGRLRHILTNFGTFPPGSPEQIMEAWIMTSGGDPAALVRVLDTFVDTPREALAAVTVPTLVLTGAADGHNETAAELASTLPRGRYQELPGDHFTAVGSPEFTAAVIEFLTAEEPAAEEPAPGERGPGEPAAREG
jgi:pimeloyl-ACP methyl ester carboxylesterase